MEVLDEVPAGPTVPQIERGIPSRQPHMHMSKTELTSSSRPRELEWRLLCLLGEVRSKQFLRRLSASSPIRGSFKATSPIETLKASVEDQRHQHFDDHCIEAKQHHRKWRREIKVLENRGRIRGGERRVYTFTLRLRVLLSSIGLERGPSWLSRGRSDF